MALRSDGQRPRGQKWQAVLDRDKSSDGRFVFAVTTTGIYCRPSCPARRPHKSHVRLFGAPASAERAGFRACRRCKPQHDALRAIKAVCAAIEASGGERILLRDLASSSGLSSSHLRRIFKEAVGVTPRAYADALRLKALRKRLREGDMVTGSLYEVGYGSSSRLYEASEDRLGMTPATYRRGGRGMHLRYGSARSPMGRVLVATTDRGVAALYIGTAEEPLLEDLRREFPQATIEKDSGALQEVLPEVLERLSGRAPRKDLPLDIQATAFQRRVWDALLKIPRGETRSYKRLAEDVGVPKGARAVAQACATNRLAVLIPCHRVIGGDGSLSGYRWGQERKRKLLNLEGALTGKRSK